jgi:hypothetical protein
VGNATWVVTSAFLAIDDVEATQPVRTQAINRATMYTLRLIVLSSSHLCAAQDNP